MAIVKIYQCAVIKAEPTLSRTERDIADDKINHDHSFKFGKSENQVKILSNSFAVGKDRLKIGGSFLEHNFKGQLGDHPRGTVDIGHEAQLGNVGLHVGLDDDKSGISLMGKATLIKSEAQLGALSVNGGVSFDTGIKSSKDGVGIYILGVGGTIGPKTEISFPYGGFSIDWRKLFG